MGEPNRAGIGVGSVVAETYEITRLLGRGGMGTVWEASHQRLPGKRVAIKVLHPDVAKDAESLARFRREAEIASRLGHPNIIEVHDFNQLEDGSPYLVLEYLQGESLDARMARQPLTVDEALLIARQIGYGLRAAHEQNIFHRDLKPQNIFLVEKTGEDAGKHYAKVLDFGISKIRGSQTVKTQDQTILGTPQYMAPEQAVGNHGAVDARTDIFALGSILYEALSGKPAFEGHTIPEVVFKVVYEEPVPLIQRAPTVAPHINAAVMRALSKKQDERFPDMGSFIESLSGRPMTSMPVPAVKRESRHSAEAVAETVASGKMPALSVGGAPTVLSQARGEPTPPPLAPRKKPNRLGLAAVGLVVGGAVVAGMLMMQPSAHNPLLPAIDAAGVQTSAQLPDDAEPLAAPVDAAPPPVDAAVEGLAVDAAVGAPDAAVVQVEVRDAGPTPPRPDAGVELVAPVSAAAREAVDRGEAALKALDPSTAATEAMKAVRAGADQQGYLLLGKARCIEKDLNQAMRARRQLGATQKRALNAYCARHGFTLPD